jgi:hypothetical protein
MSIEERFKRVAEVARQNPNFGKRLPPMSARPRSKVQGPKSKYHNAAPARSCPLDPELPRKSVLGPDLEVQSPKSKVQSDLSHREHVQQFNADAGGRDEIVLEDLKRSFDLENPRVPGEWYTGFWFFKQHGIKAANSCACRLRSNPFIANNDLDVDSSQVPAVERMASLERNEWWRYRICHRQDSERIKREEKRTENEPF